MYRTFRQVRVDCVDGSEIPAGVVVDQELGVNLYVATLQTAPQRLVATDLLGNGVFINVAETGAGTSLADGFMPSLGRGCG
jgi:hypothetical protein